MNRMIQNMYRMNFDVDVIAQVVGLSEEMIEKQKEKEKIKVLDKTA